MALKGEKVTFEAVAECCHPGSGLHCIVPKDVIHFFGEVETFVVGMTFNDIDLGRRSIKPWGDGRWFTEFTKIHCKRTDLSEGDKITCTAYPVPQFPVELLDALKSAQLGKQWNGLTKAQQRAFGEQIFEARTEKTRSARIDKVLTCLGGL